MKVLMMADVPPDPDSGAAGTEWQTARALERLGCEVHTVWAGDLVRKIGHGNLHYLLELPWRYRQKLAEIFPDMQPHVVHVNQPHGYLAARQLPRLSECSVFVHRSHGFEGRVEEELRPWQELCGLHVSMPKRLLSAALQRALRFNDRMIARHADGHIVSATECARFLQARHAVPADRIATIPQAAPPSFLESRAPPASRQRQLRMLYVGQFAFIKAPFIVAKVTESVLAAAPEARLTWVCSADHHAQARSLFSNRQVLDRVEFKAWLPQAQLRALYDEHGIFIFPSLFEGFGKAFLEAMTRGLCVVAADNGGMRDVICDQQSGSLFPTGDWKAAAESILALMNSPTAYQAISEQAVQAGRQYTWDRVGRETLSFYERLLAQKRDAGEPP